VSDGPGLKVDRGSVRLWLRILSCTRMIENEIRARLRETFGTTLPRFDLMAQLYRYPDGLRMTEISRRLMVTNGNITGIIDQLAAERLVERLPDKDDGRATTARLTAAGTVAFEAMAVQHCEWIEELTGDLSAEEQQTLFELLTRLRDQLQDRMR
jgi:DNA-binding MarR family transcriptional regulator